jgi:hypothetical protein
MQDTPTKPSHTARNTGIGIVVGLLLYVLSMGPVEWLWKKGIFTGGVISSIMPLCNGSRFTTITLLVL